MKILSRMNINPENLLKDEELKILRGGQQVDCAVYLDGDPPFITQFLCYGTASECDELCASAYYTHENAWCFCNMGY